MSMVHGKNITVIDGPNSHSLEIAGCSNVVIKNSKFQDMDHYDSSQGKMRLRDFNEFIQIDRMTVNICLINKNK